MTLRSTTRSSHFRGTDVPPARRGTPRRWPVLRPQGKSAASNLLFLLLALLTSASALPAADTTLWFRQPAKDFLEALPLGNGRLGAMAFGAPSDDRFLINESGVWSAQQPGTYDRPGAFKHLPEIRHLLFTDRFAEAESLVTRELLGDRPLGCYQPLGDLRLHFPDLASASDYRRQLDLDSAVATISFRAAGVTYTREFFASHPHQLLVIRLTASVPGAISFDATLSRPECAESKPVPTGLLLTGRPDAGKPTAGKPFAAVLRVLSDGGAITPADTTLRVRNATAVTLLLAASTDPDPAAACEPPLAAAARLPYDTLRAAHVADHQKLFRRVTLSLGPASDEPTDARLARVRSGHPDPALEALYFQFGRYLLIASSRPGGVAANLQGLWNDRLAPPWFCGYHFDVNAQMNYWPAEPLNLPDLHAPLFDLIDSLRPNGRATAKTVYNARGFVVSHRTNADRFTSPVKGFTAWPTGAAWLCQHLWEHYRFTLDRDFLATRAYPTMRESAEFFLDYLTEDPRTGKLVSGPSISPENSFLGPDNKPHGLSMGPTMDQEIIAELFDNCLSAAAVLGIDDDFTRDVNSNRARLALPGISSDGRLMEWAREYPEREPNHRHYSHLYGLYPGSRITPRGTPDLAAAARKSLLRRLAEPATKNVNLSNTANTGWSLAWTVNFFARLGDADRAHASLADLLAHSTFPSLLNGHPQPAGAVFQIDGNLGAPAGIAEMLLQSHTGAIEFLPALPKAWPDGEATGLRARGAFAVALKWQAGHLTRATLRSEKGGPCTLRLADKTAEFQTTAGQTLVLDGSLSPISKQ